MTAMEDFKPCSSKKAEPVPQPMPAQVDHKDLRHVKEYKTEAMVSYHPHSLPQITRTPRWTKLCTNFKMQTDPKEVTFLTTHSEKLQPQPFQAPPTPIRQSEAIKKIQQVEKLPKSTYKATFNPHRGSPVVKPTVKHLEEGFPTIKGDGRYQSFVSQYNTTFQGARGKAAHPVYKHSSVVMGDPVKIVERETTHTGSFSWPTTYSPPVVKERLKFKLGNFSKDSWSSTTKQTFCHHKLGDPVVLTKRNRNSSSLPKGDTDASRNKERMSVTTNRICFSDLNLTGHPVSVPGPDLMTKSHVFSQPNLSGLYYTTTAKEHYSKKDGEQARPAIQLPSNILSGQEPGVSLSTTKADFLPLKTCKQTPFQSQQTSNIRFPLAKQHFSTTHNEFYTAKPLIPQRPSCSQYVTHFVMK
uniref:Si:dkey-13m1.5 n=1 Tax=Seriola dumerili TaxID=41447 RepID=A0A3B4U4D7_SERDU